MQILKLSACLVAVGVLSLASVAFAAEGGTLKGQFLYGGKAPGVAPIAVTADKAFCGKHKLVDESLVVGSGGELANVVVFLYLSRGDSVDVHPSYDALKQKKVELTNAGCRFEPHVGLLWTEQTITLSNQDTVGHNTKVAGANKEINPLIPPNAKLDQQFPDAERLPVSVSCSIHPWMKGWLVIRDNPYFAVTDAEGKFEIKHIPAGDWNFQVWQEKAGYVRHVDAGAGETEWSRGRVEVTITEGGTKDLGQVKVLPVNFEE